MAQPSGDGKKRLTLADYVKASHGAPRESDAANGGDKRLGKKVEEKNTERTEDKGETPMKEEDERKKNTEGREDKGESRIKDEDEKKEKEEDRGRRMEEDEVINDMSWFKLISLITFSFNHPLFVKKSVVSSLFLWAYRICDNEFIDG